MKSAFFAWTSPRQFRLRDMRLRTKLAVAVVVLIAVISTFVYSYFPGRLQSQARKAIIDKASSIAAMTAYSVSAGLYFEDTEAIKTAFQGALQNTDLRYLAVYDSLGNTVADSNAFGIAIPPLDGAISSPRISADGSLLLIEAPINFNERKIGWLQMGMSLEQLSADVAASRSASAMISCLIFLFGIAAVWGISALVTRPLERIVEAVEIISRGDLTRRVDFVAGDEVGLLAQSFNLMVDNLEAAYDSLENANSSLEKQTIDLRAEIAERKRVEEDLKAFTTRLEQSNRDLQDFAFVASHDLQEPLRKIQAFGDRLAAKLGAGLDEQSGDYLKRMQNAANRMQILINDLLTYSRVTTKAQPFVPTDLAQTVREVLADLEIRIEETGGKVELGNLPALDADPLQMRQLFQNVIGNALKYYRPGVPPLVRVSGELHEDGGCRIVVEDNGIGFEQQYSEKIFGIFQRLHGRNAYEGTGVGLAVCRKIVERHGGAISAEGFPGEGARFTITLPVYQIKEERANEQGMAANYAAVSR